MASKIIWTLPFSWLIVDADSVHFECLWVVYEGQKNFKTQL